MRFIITCLLLAIAGRVSAQGDCVPVATPLAESFDAYGVGGMPPCWSGSRNYDLGQAPHLDSTQRHSGIASLYLYSGALAGSHYSMAIGPEMDIADTWGLHLSFHLYAASTATLLEVGLCDDTNRYTRHFTPIDTLHVDRSHTWQEMVVDLSPYSGTGRRVAFRLQRGLQSENSECYIDDLRISNCGTTMPTVHHIGSTTLTVEWETFGTGSVTVDYNGQRVENALSPLTLTGLTPSTPYVIAVSCDDSSPLEITATTLEGAGLFPAYYESFDGPALPAGWRTPLPCHPTVEGQRLTLRPSGDSCLAVLPLHDLDSTQRLHMALLLEADSGTHLTVGVMDFAEEVASFTAVDTLTGHGRRTVTLASYGGTGRYLALLATGNGTLRVDNLRVAHCLVDSVRLYHLTENSVTVAWDTLLPTMGSAVTVEWGPPGFAPGSGSDTTASTNPFTLTGLSPSTAYELLVYPACGDQPCGYDRHSFETFAHAVTAPYCVTFEGIGNGLPQGWVCGYGSAGGSTLAYEGTRGLHLDAGTTVTLPDVTIDADTLLADFYSQGNGSLELGLMATPYSTFTPLETLTGNGSWRHHVVPVTVPDGMLLAFRATTAWNLDAVALHRDAVGTTSVSAVDSTSAHVAWTMIHGDSVELEYLAVASALDDFDPGSGLLLHALDSVTLHGLTPGTHYALHLRPLSDTVGDGCLRQHTHLLTDASPLALPYCENFDDLVDFPADWRRKSEMGEYPIVTTERNRSPSRSMRFSATSTQRTAALLPNFDSPSGSVVLSFWTNVRLRPAGAKLLVGHLADLDDLDSFTPFDTLTFNATETWQHHNVYLDTCHTHVALMLVGGSSGETRLFVDDLCVEPCLADNISLAIDSTTATLHWRSHGVAALQVTVAGNGTTERDTFFASPAVVDGLAPDIAYTLTLKALCECGSAGGTRFAGYGTTGHVVSDTTTSRNINTRPTQLTQPYCLTFENYTTGSSPNWWKLGGGATVSDRNYHDGSHSIITGNNRILAFQPMDSVQKYTLSFFAYCSNEALLADSALQVGVMDNPDSANTFTVVASLRLTRVGEWQRLWCDLADYGGSDHYIALRMPGSDTCTLFLDDMSFFPCGLTHADVSNDGVVTWEALHNPTGVIIEYGPQGFLPGNGILDTVTAPPYSLQGITSGNNYDIYLNPFCNNRANCIPLKITLGATASTPYCEHFETAPVAGMPTGWSIARTHSGTPAIGSGTNQTLRLAGHAVATGRGIAVLPPLASDDSLQVSLSMRSANPSLARLAVGFIASNADPNTFVAVDTLANDHASQWQRLATRLAPPADRRIALCCLSMGQEATVTIDSLSVTRGISPLAAATSARTLALTGQGYVEYGLAGFSQGNGTLVLVDTLQQPLTGLTPEQEYWFYTREDSTTLTCMPPVKAVMPAEVPLPYCLGSTSFQQLQLPEMSIDSVSHLHLYLTLAGGGTVVAGVMEHDGDWATFTPVDTVAAPAATRQQLHASLARYGGSHRFVGLRSLGGTVTMETLTVSNCEWPEAVLQDDNSVMLRGYGTVEYGPAGFLHGSGTLVTVADSLRLDGLADTTLYDYYSLCDPTENPCQAPRQWHTSTTVTLPVCFDFSQGLPLGWDPFSDATNANAVSANATGITLTVASGQHVGVVLPIMESPVVDCEVWFSSATVALLADGDTLHPTLGSWQPLTLRHTGSGRLTLQATGNGTVRLRNIEANRCALPRQLVVGHPGNGQVEVSWDTTETETPFFIECHLNNSANAFSVRAEHPPLMLQLLPDTLYTLTPKCDSLGATCRPGIEVATLSMPQPVPYCADFEDCPVGQVPEGWYVLSTATGQAQAATDNAYRGQRRLHAVNGQGSTFLVLPQFDDSLRHLNVMLQARAQSSNLVLTLGTMTDAGDPATFDAVVQFHPASDSYLRCFHSFDNYYGNGRFLALRLDGNGWVDLDDLSVSDCAAYHFRLVETATDHVVLDWDSQGTPEVTVEYGPMGFTPGSGRQVTSSVPPLRIDSLEALTNHIFYVGGNCGDVCRPTVTDTFRTFTPQGSTGCIDYTDLNASFVSCAYGSYANPSEHSGVVDYGYLSSLSRHTIHFDTTERDPRTGGLLRTVPEGKQASVRLGNWTTGSGSDPQAESITYGMTVDTNQFSLLVLRYAAVLQDPEHSADLQPRFRLQILNAEGNLIDSCGMADFIANPYLQWNHAANEVLWKDWTTVGLDLSNYAGQTILIRLITNDCGEGSHFGYAYFTLECANKQMKTEGCSYVPDNRFTVPQGFSYRWYTNHDTTTVSDSSSLWVASDNSTTYYCRLSFVDNPACYFTMSAFAGARFPLAIIDTTLTVANCEFDLMLHNGSTISGDGVTPVGTGEPCETGRWTLPDGSTSEASSLSFHYADTGSYTFTLIAGIADDQCLDTLQRTIHITYPHPAATIEGRTRRCDNESQDTFRVHHATLYAWADSTIGDIMMAPMVDTTLTCYTVDSNGCHDTLHHTLHILPTYNLAYSDSACNTESSYLWIDTTVAINQTSGIMHRTRYLTSADGCDSTMTLALTLMPSYYLHHHDTLCHDTPLPFFDTVLTTTGDYLHIDSTDFGCDSMVTMHLEVIPRSFTDDVREVCDSLTWIDGRTYLYDTDGVDDTLASVRGCDSVVTLRLTVHHSTYEVTLDTFCQGSRYLWRSHTLHDGGHYADTLATQYGCDSVIALDLTRLDLPQVTLVSDLDCATLKHRIVANTDVRYLQWSSSPYDPELIRQEHDRTIVVKPHTTTLYMLYADYSLVPRCPVTDTITVSPKQGVTANLKVLPQALIEPYREFDAYDIGADYGSRLWIVNDEILNEASRHLHYTLPEGVDTAWLSLLVSDGTCDDTASAMIPLLGYKVTAPNAFTPDRDNNNTFRIYGKGIVTAEIRIFNRMGAVVYKSNDINQEWDGRDLNGNPCPAGGYVWQIRFTSVVRNNINEEKGTITLIR